jgi:adenosylmethionine-8-amino-7-oxononanoate aminotransferase
MSVVKKDLKYIWHPCMQAKRFETMPPIAIERASGLYLYDTQGNKYADMISSWWCNLLGHCNPRINEAVKNQIDKLEHVIFADFTHEKAVELCERLVKFLPVGLDKFFFTDNGSSSVEAAMKMSFQYHIQTGSPQKKRFMALNGGYHGETLGALSAGALDLYTQIYKPILLDVIRLETDDFEHADKMFAQFGHETCALIVEPILQMAAGMKIYSAAYLKHLRNLCDKYNVHLIADEIATGFGRTGKMFACEWARISPDIMCVSKGLTGGYMPGAIAITTRQIYDAFYADTKDKAFLHSHTYCANPLMCAAAVEVLKIFEEENILEQAQENALYFSQQIKNADCPSSADILASAQIRSIGLINAMDLPNANKIAQKALKNGVFLRPLGNTLYFNPPLTITKSEIDEVIKIVF